jgi:dTDP-4-amino-4,6-dideoxygalactose transaminase
MQSEIGRIKLIKFPIWTKQRQQNAAVLTEYFKKIPAFRVTEAPDNMEHAYYKYYVFVRDEKLKSGWNRDRIMQAINDEGVPCYSGICGEIYLEKAFTNSNFAQQERFETAKKLGETSLMFLVHPTLTQEHMAHAAKVVTKIMIQASS